MGKLAQTRNSQVKLYLSLWFLYGSAGAILLTEFASFTCANRTNLLCQSPGSSRLLIDAKGLLNLPNLVMLIKQGSSREIVKSILKKDKSAIPPLFIGPEVLSFASDEADLFSEIFL